MNYESTVTRESAAFPGVSFTVVRMSFGRRIDLLRRVRELGRREEFHAAGEGLGERAEAGLLNAEIERLYLEWGLVGIAGLEIEGRPAATGTLLAAGPEELCREIAAAVRAECGLSEEASKN
ncbi:MAG: hypothetical protein HYZ57_15965 [Acidobacteria bacterium]|nr:hypothetical protein [Acidobacteriota bacterium]